MVNGSLVQFNPILFTKGTVKCYLCCMCKKKRPGKKCMYDHTSMYPILFPSFLLNF